MLDPKASKGANPTRIQRLGSYAFVTTRDDKKEEFLLLSLLNRGPNRGKWGLIGGGVEFTETPKDALFREMKEEAGIDLVGSGIEPVLIDVTSHDYQFVEPETGEHKHLHFIGIIHTITLPKLVPGKPDGDGFSSDGTRWVPLRELNEAELHPAVIRVLKRSS